VRYLTTTEGGFMAVRFPVEVKRWVVVCVAGVVDVVHHGLDFSLRRCFVAVFRFSQSAPKCGLRRSKLTICPPHRWPVGPVREHWLSLRSMSIHLVPHRSHHSNTSISGGCPIIAPHWVNMLTIWCGTQHGIALGRPCSSMENGLGNVFGSWLMA
jgi:hypothetical protein